MQMCVERYHNDIEKYKKQLIKGKIIHRYRDGFGNVLPDGFDRRRYINQVRVPEFRDKIKYFLEHEDERLKIAARGELKARKYYNHIEFWEKVTSKLKEVQELVS